MMLWNPMFLSSLKLAIKSPGFTIGYECDDNTSNLTISGLVLLDLILFLIHPILLRFRASVLKKRQESIKESRDLRLSQEYERNIAKIASLEDEYYKFKRFELNLETLGQITLSLLLYMYGQSETTTSNSLKAVFKEDAMFCRLTMSREESLDIGSYLDIPPTYAIVLNFGFSLMSFTWLVTLLIHVF